MSLPAALAEIAEDFNALPEPERLELLLEFSDNLPALPARFDGVELEQVTECQSPVFLTVEVADDAQRTVNVFITAPPQAPTTRGFAGVLKEGLDSLPAAAVLAVPDDFPSTLGLTRAVSPLRLRGMTAMLGRIKRRVAAALEG
ncbi:SufE family protein [Galactobacter valiniphilus]|uniref:SufE family protein n=1 Tax=Galactobacter valiniphilus TaxID=2676122 RepID=UPI003735AFE4